jgi:hypothetical protein
LKNHDIDDALSEIIIRASEEGFIDEQMENQIMVVVSADNSKQEQELADLVDVIATNQLSKINNKFGVMVEKASVESYKEALSNKQSPGKEILADRLREVNPEIKDEEVMDMSVREVVHLINEGRKAIMEAEKDKDKEQQSATNKDVAKKEDKEAAKADSKAKKDNKCSDKHKPAAAINKDNTSTSNNGNNDKNEKEDKVKADKDNKGNGDKDSEEENADKDKNDNKGLEDKDNQNNGADGQVNNDDAKDDGGDVEGKYKENNNGKKGD